MFGEDYQDMLELNEQVANNYPGYPPLTIQAGSFNEEYPEEIRDLAVEYSEQLDKGQPVREVKAALETQHPAVAEKVWKVVVFYHTGELD